MTDATGLSRHHVFTPPAGGLETAMEAGRKRRVRRRLTQAGAAVTGLALLAVVTIDSAAGEGQETLSPAVRGGHPQSPAPSASATPASSATLGAKGSAGPGRPPAGGQLEQSARELAAGPPVAAAPRHRSAPSQRPEQAPPRRGPYEPVKRAYIRGGAPEDCTSVDDPPVTVRGERLRRCSGASVTGTGATRTLGVDFCVADLESEPVTFSFTSDREVSWVVRDTNGQPVWEWGRGAVLAGADHEVVVSPGDCLTWRTTWSAVDDSGLRVDRGNYRLHAALVDQGEEHRYTATTTV